MLSPGHGQESLVRDGSPALVSQKKNLVMLRANNRLVESGSRPAFTLVVRNLSSKSETLLESAITAQQTVSGRSVALRVYRYDELIQEEQNRQAWAAVGAAFSAAGRSISAADAGYTTTTGSVAAYGSGGSAYGTYSATTYDPLRAQIAQQNANAQTASEVAALRAEGEQNLNRLQETMLKDNAVLPGEWYGGSIVLAPPQKADDGSSSYVITVDFAGEQHSFAISQVGS
jgi:hypothetical protein